MKQIYIGTRLQVLLFGLLIINSCSKFDFDNIKTDNLNTEWGAPLVQSKLTLTDFLNDTSGTIHVDENGLISLIYESNDIVSIEAKDRTKIPDLSDTTTKAFTIFEGAKSLPMDDSITLDSIPIVISFDLEDKEQRIDQLDFTNGLYTITFRTDLNRNFAHVRLTVPNFTDKYGAALTQYFDISNPPPSDEVEVSATINLFDYSAHFINDDSLNPNTITIWAEISFKYDDNGFDSSYTMNLINELKDIEYSSFFGYIGEYTETYSDTIDLNIFNSVDGGSITFGEGCVKLNVDLYNELGIPIKIEAEEFTAYHTSGANPDTMDIYFIDNGNDPNTIIMNTPDCNAVTGVFTNIEINNSNILEAIGISPNKIYFKLNGKLNYDGVDTSTNCFMDTSEFKIDVKLELDLFGSISTFIIADTIDFSIESVENLNAIDLRIVITNGFPINAAAQVEFLDADNQLLYTLFPNEEEIIVSASIGGEPDFRVIQPSKKETIITIDGDAMESILKASQVVFKSTLSTPDSLVKIYSDYSIDLNLSAKLYVNY